ncbi:MAG: hypothetical protein IJX92_07055 [Clostridia bacterium]|nr:hypothetical protein [Clostridia bacterium]
MRGYQKKVIYIKHTGSNLFDEAYFVVGSTGENAKRSDMILEANRIIEESIKKEPRKKKTALSDFLYPFMIGILVSVVVFVIVLTVF